MPDTPLISLPLLEASQAQKHVTHNEALLLLDAVVHLAVISRALAAPPVSPADGERYLVAASATGDWLGHSGHLAFREAGAWRFAVPKAGWRLWVVAESLFLVFDGTVWIDLRDFDELQNMDLLGVNTTADAANKLSVASANVLFTHMGEGQRVKLNKNAAGDTASLLYQTGFSGRAEMGTTGDDDFHFKVSPDGSAWTEALVIDKTTGVVKIPASLELGHATDTTLSRVSAGLVAVEGVNLLRASDIASDAEIRAAASGDKPIKAASIETASAFVALTINTTPSPDEVTTNGTILDWDAFINATLTHTANMTLINPSNGQPGTWRSIAFTQHSSPVTITLGSNYKTPGAAGLTVSTGNGEKDLLTILCVSGTEFWLFHSKDMS
ncbi:MAG: DUF2793 domain-containing protein [Hyphomicrobiales bacterium]|nr:DUF2793 domain-containing protein [Hyphomicrobiales bacterium]